MSVNLFRSVIDNVSGYHGASKKDGKIRMQASAYCVDSKGLLVRQDGFDMSRFQRNPVLLWGHDHDEVIGRADTWGFNETGLWFEPVFSSSEKGKQCKQDVEDGIIRACSIGGRIAQAYFSWNSQEDKPDEFALLTDEEKSLLAARKITGVILKLELWEISFCAIGANPEALRLSVSDQESEIKAWIDGLEKLERGASASGATKEREEQCMSSPLDDEVKRKQELSAKLDEEIQTKQSARAKMEQDIEAKKGSYAELVAQTEKLRLQAIGNRWTLALNAGKTIPATKEVELALLATMNEKQVDAYFQILEARAPLFETLKQSQSNPKDPHSVENSVDMDYLKQLDQTMQKVGA